MLFTPQLSLVLFSFGRKQTEALIATVMGQTGKRELEQPSPKAPLVVIPSFDPFDPTTELWDDYWAWFQTFVGANSVPMPLRWTRL